MSTNTERAERELRAFARLQVRAGLLNEAEQLDEVREAVAAELPHTDPGILARAWLAAARKELLEEQAGWPATTDVDRLRAAFVECQQHGVKVLAGVEDHWAARRALEEAAGQLRGVIWFVVMDVWHAVDTPMLEVNLWHADGANAAEGDALTTSVLACLERHGLRARFDEGRIEVAALWQRRI
ncbi:DUF6891 domain-containing protein [Nocardioides jiangxiensis]|uniref:DUF6891 domain-containing protein n=1 Tax=Nocardioides jiangxiensis TaxID=3064524 RepID=A0ABT9B009_9ACTN|nr:hypothetical protein [Nocardioides sp. WY-20]MDO7866942.1 hypothetical protein [Nocardioides sp. WY-20]